MVSQLIFSKLQEIVNIQCYLHDPRKLRKGYASYYLLVSSLLSDHLYSLLYFEDLEAGLLLAGFRLILPAGGTNVRLGRGRNGEAKFSFWQWWPVQGWCERLLSSCDGGGGAVVQRQQWPQ